MAANARTFARGWLDTKQNIQDILKADEFLSKLITRNADLTLLRRENINVISSAVQIVCGARYLAHRMAQRTPDYVKSVVIGELMAPVLPTTLSLPTAEANKEFKFICEYLIANDTSYNRNKTGVQWIAELGHLIDSDHTADRSQLPELARMTIEDYQHYLIWLAMSLPKSQSMSALQLVVTSYVGAAKRGTVSERFIEKVTNGVRDDIGEEIVLDVDVIHTTYNNFGRYITSENAEAVFRAWLDDIPEHALRLRLTLEQVSGSGLTAFLVAGRAMKKYINFPWGKLNKLTGNEMNSFVDAVRLVNGNPYYGFNRDLKAAKSTNFSTVAYVAKELLIQIAGESSLKNYQGWIKKPKSPVVIKKLIDDYVASYNEELINDSITEAEVTETRHLIELVSSETNINLFT